MHIGYDFKDSMFSVSVDGKSSSSQDLLNWDARDRIGVVVNRPFGALDASLITLLAGVAFYDHDSQRRRRTLYPDMYLIHAGGPWGSFASFDFSPSRKEVFVADDPAEILGAVNQVGVTHLVIPDKEQRELSFPFKEPEEAHNRIKQVYAYGRSDEAEGYDVTIGTDQYGGFVETVETVLWPERLIARLDQGLETRANAAASEKVRMEIEALTALKTATERRQEEVGRDEPERLRQIARFEEAQASNRLTESYRRVDVATALKML